MRNLRFQCGDRHFSHYSILFYRCAVYFGGDTSVMGQRFRSIQEAFWFVNTQF